MRKINHSEIIEELINYMSEEHNEVKVTVMWVMDAYESIIKKHLLDTSQGKEDVVIKIMDGITLERKYIPEKQNGKGVFKDKPIKEHFNIKVNVTKSFKDFANSCCFNPKKLKKWLKHRHF